MTQASICYDGWYLAQLKPGGHDRAVLNLERQGFQTLMPMRQETRRVGGRWANRVRPLFPGYLFVRVAQANTNWSSINSTYGVSRLVSLDAGRPTPVEPALIEALRNRTRDDGQLDAPESLKIGDMVRVVSGPLSEKLVQIESMDEKDRIYVFLDLMGRYAKAALSISDVEAV